MTDANRLTTTPENTEWVAMKCLLDAQRETTRAMEHHALSSLTQREQLSNRELVATLQEARHSHERAIADIETALEVLDEQSTVDESSAPDSIEQ